MGEHPFHTTESLAAEWGCHPEMACGGFEWVTV